jgi:hypothetical protein
MKIIVAQILPMNPTGCAHCSQGAIDLNAAIPAWAAGLSTAQSPITVVDQWTGFNTATDTGDGVHPNDVGNQKISDKWYPALAALLTVGGVTATPTRTFTPNVNTPTRTITPSITTTRSATPIFTISPTRTSTLTNLAPTLTHTRTPTSTVGASRTPTPTGSMPPWTPTRTRTFTPSPTSGTGTTCSPVSATITAPFTYDGAGTFCWQSSNLGSYINNWNNTSVTINGVNITNLYMAAASYPAKIGGFWYVSYNGPFAWSHFEVK